MLEVIHRPAAEDGWGWEFSCISAPRVEGGGRTYRASVAAAEHAARLHLSATAGGPLALEQVRRDLRHLRLEPRLQSGVVS